MSVCDSRYLWVYLVDKPFSVLPSFPVRPPHCGDKGHRQNSRLGFYQLSMSILIILFLWVLITVPVNVPGWQIVPISKPTTVTTGTEHPAWLILVICPSARARISTRRTTWTERLKRLVSQRKLKVVLAQEENGYKAVKPYQQPM